MAVIFILYDSQLNWAGLFARMALLTFGGINQQRLLVTAKNILHRPHWAKRTPHSRMNQYPKCNANGSGYDTHHPERFSPVSPVAGIAARGLL